MPMMSVGFAAVAVIVIIAVIAHYASNTGGLGLILGIGAVGLGGYLIAQGLSGS